MRIFRDETDLTAAPGLWPEIVKALSAAEWLILMASPAAAASGWVQREVNWWLENRSPDRILIALVGGQLIWRGDDFDWTATDAVPGELANAFRHEPCWVDLRPLRPTAPPDPTRPASAAARTPQLRLGDIVADFAAPIRGVDKGTLTGEHIRQRRRTRRTVATAVASLTALTIVAATLAVVALDEQARADRERGTAVHQRDKALANQLVAEAGTVEDTQPGLARQLLAGAGRLSLTPQVAGALISGRTVPREIHLSAGSFAFSPDGRTLAAVKSGRTEPERASGTLPARDGEVTLYDNRTLKASGHIGLGETPAGPIAVSRTNLLAVAQGSTVRIWDIARPQHPETRPALAGHDSLVDAVAISPDGRTAASVAGGSGYDGELILWDLTNPDRPERITSLRSPRLRDTSHHRLQFQPGGGTLALTGGADSPVFFDLSNPRRPTVLPTRDATRSLRSLSFAPDGQHLVAYGDNRIRRWAVEEKGVLSKPRELPLSEPLIEIDNIAYGAGGRVAAIAENGRVHLWEQAPGSDAAALVAQLPVPEWDSYNSEELGFSPDGTQLAMLSPGSNAGPGGADVGSGTLRIWNVVDGRQRGAVGAAPGLAALSPNGRLLAAVDGPDGDTIRLWDTSRPRTPRPLGAVKGPGAEGLVFSPDGRTVAAQADGAVWTIDVHDPRRPRALGTWRTPGAMLIMSLLFYDNRVVAAGDLTGSVFLLDTKRAGHLGPVGTLATTRGAVTSMAVIRPAPDRPLLAVTGFEKGAAVVQLWDVSDPANGRPADDALSAGNYQTQQLAVSRDGKLLAAAKRDGTVLLWRFHSPGKAPYRFPRIQDTGDVNEVELSGNGKRLVTVGRDRTIRSYDVGASDTTLQAILHIGHGADTELSFAGDDHTLAVSTSYGKINFWELDPDSNIEELCTGVGKRISPEEWTRHVPDLPYRPPC
ncbi:hypothetical protein [Streptomyces sp. NBC_01210]|uniref:hypothetical protein n=1 Tax=Streptomyces sp. NBC_01210 TaxID=2903774 RepID=UPI002E10FE4B